MTSARRNGGALLKALALLGVLAFALSIPGDARAAPYTLGLTISNPQPGASDGFGFSVAAAAGGNILAGAISDSPGGVNDAGSAYLINGTTGATMLTIPNPFPSAGAEFGRSVAAVGGKIAVSGGGPGGAGAVHLFNGTTGVFLQTIDNPAPAGGDYFGLSLAAVGGNLLVGAPQDDPGGVSNAGSAYLFNGTTGALLLTVPNPAPTANDYFGGAVGALGGNILVGAHGDDPGGVAGAGSVYLFNGAVGTLGFGTLLPNGAIPNPFPAAGDAFGYSVAAMGGNVLAGTPNDTASGVAGAGTAYLLDGTTGARLLTIPNPTPVASDQFGNSVAAVGGNILVGDYWDDPGGVLDAGSAYLFDGASGALLQAIPNPAPVALDQFGWPVAALGGDILAGAAGIPGVGSVYRYDAPLPTPTPSPPPPSGNTPAGNDVSVALGGGLGTIGGVQLTFSTVTAAGDTTLSTQTGGKPPPTGLKIVGTGGQPLYYNLDTTATFSGPVTICIKYDGSQVSAPESQLKLMHDTASGFVNITTSVDTVNDIICGSTTSFSAFAVMEEETAVGGIAGLVDGESAPRSADGSGGAPYASTAAIAAGVMALGACGWYARRRFSRN